MGGPCRLTRPGKLATTGPAATDNFQLRPFSFGGDEWQSVEQCYQAHKKTDPRARAAIRAITPRTGERAAAHGMRCWDAGQTGKNREDWDAVKVEVMLRACRAQYSQHADLRADLLATGLDTPLGGAPSTGWRDSKTGEKHSWTHWNGVIQTLCRDELGGRVDAAAASTAAFAAHLVRAGGARLPLPEEGAAPLTPEGSSAAVAPPPPPVASPPMQCVVCVDAPADHLVLPCGHQCGCAACLEEIRGSGARDTAVCPICRSRIEGLVRVFATGVVPAANDPASPCTSSRHDGNAKREVTSAAAPTAVSEPRACRATKTSSAAELYEHAKAGRWRRVLVLPLTAEVAAFAKPRSGWTLLHQAAYWGDAEAAQALVAAGSDVRARTRDDETPADVARAHGHAALADAALAPPPMPTPLPPPPDTHAAELYEHVKAAKWTAALAALASDDWRARRAAATFVKPRSGWTSLHQASYWGHAEMARALIVAGADTQARTHDGETPADVARARGHDARLILAVEARN